MNIFGLSRIYFLSGNKPTVMIKNHVVTSSNRCEKIIGFSSHSFCFLSFLCKFCNMCKRLAFVLFLSLATFGAYSQCAVCKTTISSSADKESAKGLNGGILYLAAMPLLFMGF